MSRPVRPPRFLPRHAGHTLVELLVVGVIMSIISIVVMKGSAPMAWSSLHLRNRNLSSNELRMAVESLLQDLGGAERLKIQSGLLHIEREAAVLQALGLYSGSKDLGVEYRLDEGSLWRQDLEAGSDLVVARDLEAWAVARIPGVGIRVTAVAGVDDAERTVELTWSY